MLTQKSLASFSNFTLFKAYKKHKIRSFYTQGEDKSRSTLSHSLLRTLCILTANTVAMQSNANMLDQNRVTKLY